MINFVPLSVTFIKIMIYIVCQFVSHFFILPVWIWIWYIVRLILPSWRWFTKWFFRNWSYCCCWWFYWSCICAEINADRERRWHQHWHQNQMPSHHLWNEKKNRHQKKQRKRNKDELDVQIETIKKNYILNSILILYDLKEINTKNAIDIHTKEKKHGNRRLGFAQLKTCLDGKLWTQLCFSNFYTNAHGDFVKLKINKCHSYTVIHAVYPYNQNIHECNNNNRYQCKLLLKPKDGSADSTKVVWR